MFTSRT